MRKRSVFLSILLASLLAAPLFAQGQQGIRSNPLGGNIFAASSTCATVQSCVWQQEAANVSAVSVTITGTFSATLVIEISADGGNTFTTYTTVSTTGLTTVAAASLTDVRVRASAYTSGSAGVLISAGTGATPAFVFIGLLANIPATCSVGQIAFVTNATAGQNIYECASANTWTQQLNSGGGGGGINITVNGGANVVTPANFNNTTPSAGANFLNCTWQISGSNISVECPSGTTSSSFLLGNTVLPVTITNGSHQWLNSYTSTTGIFTQTQPAFTDISGVAAVGQIPTAIPIANIGSAGLSGTSPITINAAGAIGCATCNTSSATVSTVSFTGGLISVATPTTTPAFTVAGTSGGIPYFSAASTWASSGALTQFGVVFGGGAGGSPTVSAQGGANFPLIGQGAANPIFSTIAYPTSLTSGGVLYGSSTTALSSSGLLTLNLPVIGGGAGAAPTVGTVTGNTTQFATWTGATTASRCVHTDANGNLIIAAADCASAPALSAVTAATGSNTIASGNNPQTWNWALTTDAIDGMAFGETSAATGGTLTGGLANQAIVAISTATNSTAVALEVAQGSITNTVGTPLAQFEATWNNSGLSGIGLLLNVVNTSSATGSRLFDFQVGGTSQGKLDKAGNATFLTSVQTGSAPPACTAGTAGFWCAGEGTVFTNVASTAGIYPDSTTHEYGAITNGSSLVGMLARVQPGQIHQTGKTAAITTATLCASSAGACNIAGMYTVEWAFTQGGTACGTPGTGGVTFLLTWTDTNGNAHSAVSLAMDDSASLVATTGTFHFTTANTTAWASGQFNISTNGSIIQYATGYTACGVGTGTYQLDITVTRKQ
jgi:hypothetical protein